MKKNIKTHPVADLYPLNQENVDAIAADIKANGQKLPILTLQDGRIVDGRNRYMACQKLGITPKTECIENGKPLSDGELYVVAMTYNEKRRQLSKMQAACVAALAWKMLHPEESRGRPKLGENKTPKSGFYQFAKDNHGVGKDYATQALAVANWNTERLGQAKDDPRGLADAYEEYQEAGKAEKLKVRREKILGEHEDLLDRYQSGQLTVDEALTLAAERNAEREEDERTERSQAERAARAVTDFITLENTPDALDAAIRLEIIAKSQLIKCKKTASLISGGRK